MCPLNNIDNKKQTGKCRIFALTMFLLLGDKMISVITKLVWIKCLLVLFKDILTKRITGMKAYAMIKIRNYSTQITQKNFSISVKELSIKSTPSHDRGRMSLIHGINATMPIVAPSSIFRR